MANSGTAWQAATLVDCVAAAQQGDQHAFTELFERHRRFAWSVARPVTRTHQAAEEATIDGFAAAFRSIARLREPQRFPSYLAACVRNEALQAARRQGATTVGTLDELEQLGGPGTDQDTPEGQLVRSEESRRALAALERLEDRQREAVLLVDVEGIQPAEVAANLGLTVNALHQLLHRARESLRLRYVTPVISESAPSECRTCTDKLGLYLAGRASVRVVSMVDLHTANCPDCQDRLAEAREVNDTVRAAYGAAPVGLLALLISRHGFGARATDAHRAPRTGPSRHRRLGRGTGRRGGRKGPKGSNNGAGASGGQSGASAASGSGSFAPLRMGVTLAQRLTQAVSHFVVAGPLSALPAGAVLAVASASLTTVAAMAASLPVALLPGAESVPAVGGPIASAGAAPATTGIDGALRSSPSAFSGAAPGTSVPATTVPVTAGPSASASGTLGAGSSGSPDDSTTAGSTGGLGAAIVSAPATASANQEGAGTGPSTGGGPASGGSTGGTASDVGSGTTSSGGGGATPASGSAGAATFLSGTATTFVVGHTGTFSVQASGSAVPVLAESGALPEGITFSDDHNGTAVLAGTPGAAGSYPVSFTAVTPGHVTTQSFTLTVDQSPAFTSEGPASFYSGEDGSVTLHATGSPAPTLTDSGALPPGLTFVDQGGGTAVVTGTPGSSVTGTFPITVSAANGVGTAATIALAIVVTQPGPLQFTSSPWAFCMVGRPCQLTVSASGVPTPALAISGALPSGLTFVDNHNGTTTISGTPSTQWQSGYSVTLTASSGGRSVTQVLHLFVLGWH